MRTKSAYKTPAPVPEIKDEPPPQPSESVKIDFDKADKAAEPSVVIVSADEFPQPDEATLALQKQLADLRESERLQREFATQVAAQRVAQQQAQPMSREQKLEVWKSQGLSDLEAEFLRARPALIDHPQITQQAVAAAAHAGLERGSDDFHNAVENNFNTLMARAQTQPAAADPAGFFAPRPAPPPMSEHDQRASIVSAPVSRREAGGPREPTSPRQVRLSPAELEIAKVSGLTATQYAEGKLAMLRRKPQARFHDPIGGSFVTIRRSPGAPEALRPSFSSRTRAKSRRG